MGKPNERREAEGTNDADKENREREREREREIEREREREKRERERERKKSLVSHYSALGDTISCDAPYSAIGFRGKLFLRYPPC